MICDYQLTNTKTALTWVIVRKQFSYYWRHHDLKAYIWAPYLAWSAERAVLGRLRSVKDGGQNQLVWATTGKLSSAFTFHWRVTQAGKLRIYIFWFLKKDFQLKYKQTRSVNSSSTKMLTSVKCDLGCVVFLSKMTRISSVLQDQIWHDFMAPEC